MNFRKYFDVFNRIMDHAGIGISENRPELVSSAIIEWSNLSKELVSQNCMILNARFGNDILDNISKNLESGEYTGKEYFSEYCKNFNVSPELVNTYFQILFRHGGVTKGKRFSDGGIASMLMDNLIGNGSVHLIHLDADSYEFKNLLSHLFDADMYDYAFAILDDMLRADTLPQDFYDNTIGKIFSLSEDRAGSKELEFLSDWVSKNDKVIAQSFERNEYLLDKMRNEEYRTLSNLKCIHILAEYCRRPNMIESGMDMLKMKQVFGLSPNHDGLLKVISSKSYSGAAEVLFYLGYVPEEATDKLVAEFSLANCEPRPLGQVLSAFGHYSRVHGQQPDIDLVGKIVDGLVKSEKDAEQILTHANRWNMPIFDRVAACKRFKLKGDLEF